MKNSTKIDVNPTELNSALIVFQMVRNNTFNIIENNNNDLKLLAKCLEFVKNPLGQMEQGLEVLN